MKISLQRIRFTYLHIIDRKALYNNIKLNSQNMEILERDVF